MRVSRLFPRLGALSAALVLAVACAPAAPASPTAAPAKPPATTAPATTAPAKPAATTAPAKPATKPAAQPAYDEKAVAEFYKDKTIRMVIGAGAGGGYDTYSRLIGRHLSKYIPGNPNVVPENMPGSGSLIAVNHMANVAPKDGTTIASMQGSVLSQQLFGAQGVEFDATKFHVLGAPTSDDYLMLATQKSGVTSLDQVLGENAREFVLGSDAPGNMLEDSAVLVRDVLGAKIKVVSGYDGTAQVRLAMDQGEVDGVSGFSWSSVAISSKEKVDSGEWVILTQFTEQPIQPLPQVPTILTYAKTDEQKQLLRNGVILPGKFARPYVVHPDVPADRVAALQDAFSKVFQDKELLAEAEKSKIDLNPLSGAELKKLMQEYMAMSPELKTKLQTMLRPS